MAAPTDVRVEANAIGQATIRWTYPGASSIGVYRALTSGGSYTLVGTVLVGTVLFVDETLAEKIQYFYKLSDDVGGTFSSIVNVISYTIESIHGANQAAFNSFASTPEDLAWQLQELNNKNTLENTPCSVCVINGGIVIDCSTGCNWFRVVVDQDINSISIISCVDCPPVDFILPPGETHGICGWPTGCEYTWDECFQAPVTGGVGGRTAKTSGLSYGGYGGQGGGAGAKQQSCPCPSALKSGCVTDCLRIACCS